MADYPRDEVRAIFDTALRDSRRRRPRRTPMQAAADKLVAALVVLLDGDIDPADRVALEDARAVVEKYRTGT